MKKSLVAVLLLLLAASGAVMLATPPAEVEAREKVIDSLSGRPLRTLYILPKAKDDGRRRPAIVAIPPYSIPPEAMEILCYEAARRDAVCVIPDFFGRTPEESRQRMGADSLYVMRDDVRSIVRDLSARKYVDPKKIGLCGHSVGGTVTYLVASAEPEVRAAAPIGMETDIDSPRRPQNLLFISGLYDEIHSPPDLLDNLTDQGITIPDAVLADPAAMARVPANGQRYGDFADGGARQVTIIPTTDHFIETFDPWLIRELLAWYAAALDAPELAGGPLFEWRRRVAAFGFVLAAAALYSILAGEFSIRAARRLGPRQPAWLIMRLIGLPLVPVIVGLGAAAASLPAVRVVALDLMILAVLGQDLASHRARGDLEHPGRSPLRLLRGAALLGLALGAATLLAFGLACLSYFFIFPEMALWYPVFAAKMAVLFPLEVWGRSRPWFFTDRLEGVHPRASYYVLAGVALLAPGLLVRGVDRVARELVVTVRTRLGAPRPAPGPTPPPPAEAGVTPLKLALAAVLLAILVFLGYRRVREGMLNWETAGLALLSILRFAVLPFLVAALIVGRRWFKKLSLLD